ncbi:Calcium-binding protein CML24 [Taenia solium]|eukprot:TsM_000141900 transcript=TsM_000141900 gene=TsM_000141900
MKSSLFVTLGLIGLNLGCTCFVLKLTAQIAHTTVFHFSGRAYSLITFCTNNNNKNKIIVVHFLLIAKYASLAAIFHRSNLLPPSLVSIKLRLILPHVQIPESHSFFLLELHDAFVLFDANHDGRIAESELNSMLCFLGIKASASDVKKMIADADIDGEFLLT